MTQSQSRAGSPKENFRAYLRRREQLQPVILSSSGRGPIGRFCAPATN